MQLQNNLNLNTNNNNKSNSNSETFLKTANVLKTTLKFSST